MATTDITNDAVLLLRAIEQTKGRFGFSLPIEVLLGRRNAKIKKSKFDELSSHGTGCHRTEEHWKAVGRSLVQELLVDSRSAGKGFGKASMAVYSVSSLGKQLLTANGTGAPHARVQADLVADSLNVESERALRATRKANRASIAKTQGSPPPPLGMCTGTGPVSSSPPTAPKRGKTERPPATPSSAASVDSAIRSSDDWLPVHGAKRRKLPASMCASEGASPAAASSMPSSATATAAQSNGHAPRPCPGPIPAPSPIPPALDKALMPFQRAGVAFAVGRGGRVLIGDDMGLGKTIQAIATCAAFREDLPAIIVVPNSVRLVWADELERWIPDLGPGGVNVVSSSTDLLGLTANTAAFHIVTYGILARASPVRDFLRERTPFKVMVVDESHIIKNRTAMRTREVLHMAQRATRILLLSGTPALARPCELYTQIEAVEPGLFKSYSSYTARYCAPKWTPFGMDFTGASNLHELHAHLKSIMVRRLKSDVLTELPAKRRQRIQIEVDATATDALSQLKEEMIACGQEQTPERRAMLMRMYKESSEAKAAPVCEYVEDLLQGGCKFLVFGHHHFMLDALEATAVRNKVKFIRIDGRVSSAERLRMVNEFQANDDILIAILSIAAAGVGITLTAASTVIFAELHWTPGLLVQAEDRAHRIGQKSSVNIQYLVASGTIDDIIWPAVSRKVEVVSTMCDGHKDHLVAALKRADRQPAKDGQCTQPSASETECMTEDHMHMDELVATVVAHKSLSNGARKKPQAAVDAASAAPKIQSAYSVLSMLQGNGPVRRVVVRDSPPDNEVPIGIPPSRLTEEEVITIPDPIESASEPEQEAEVPRCSFCVSRVTGRVHILDAEGKPLGCSFKPIDWEAIRDSVTLPDPLRGMPSVISATDTFVLQWANLRPKEQRKLLGQPLQPPLLRNLQLLSSGRKTSTKAPSAARRGKKSRAGAESLD
eukprot:gnl/TRDRNA2_/TRDRNA2_173423_c0_seq2.p1 gnl/TRDRNA2_/TRDRNA2_173423_c0~~gnl/TRDRNA2_/TRDRNA2_173423_c0_seq2.p1  ORF type:complete len:949 (-),score=141.59 gnl/TRDRNA2_/TRDRNA2_173423_c0_seq2:245-3091(-)